MIAIQYDRHGGPEVLEVVAEPARDLGPGEIRVAMRYASVTPLDWKLRSGLLRAHFELTFPKVPGRDGSGVVTETGPGIEGFAPGDRVCVMAAPAGRGTYSEERISLASDLVAIPPLLGDGEAASLVNAGLSAHVAVFAAARIEPGMTVLVHAGSGAVGGLIVQLLKNAGCAVTATCRAANRDYVRDLGADRVIAYDEEDFGVLRDQDLVFDLVGGETHARSYQVLKKGGQLVWLVAAPIVDHGVDRGAEHGVTVTRAMIADAHEPVEAVLSMAERGEIRPQIADVLPLREAETAHRRMQAGEISRGRLLLRTG
ncbi:MAG: NADPH:quinone oxidoreductase [Fulvimarina sp.]|nr:NADPH:quinone oxidoreductase [Fulvimarina sp.]